MSDNVTDCYFVRHPHCARAYEYIMKAHIILAELNIYLLYHICIIPHIYNTQRERGMHAYGLFNLFYIYYKNSSQVMLYNVKRQSFAYMVHIYSGSPRV